MHLLNLHQMTIKIEYIAQLFRNCKCKNVKKKTKQYLALTVLNLTTG